MDNCNMCIFYLKGEDGLGHAGVEINQYNTGITTYIDLEHGCTQYRSEELDESREVEYVYTVAELYQRQLETA